MLAAEDWLSLLLVFVRVLPLGIALSLLSQALVPTAVSLSLSMALALALQPLAGHAGPWAHLGTLLLALLRELCIGSTFALALGSVFTAVGWSVRLSRGHGDPYVVDAFARVYVLAAAWLVLSLGGLRALVIGLAESFHDAGLGLPGLDARAFALGTAQLFVDALATALGVGLPLLVSVWLLELATSLVLRVLAPAPVVHAAVLRPLLFFAAAALLMVPIASAAPEAVRGAIAAARALTRALGK